MSKKDRLTGKGHKDHKYLGVWVLLGVISEIVRNEQEDYDECTEKDELVDGHSLLITITFNHLRITR